MTDVSTRQVGDVWWYNGNKLRWDGVVWKKYGILNAPKSPVPESIDVHGPPNNYDPDLTEQHSHQRIVPCHINCPAYVWEHQKRMKKIWESTQVNHTLKPDENEAVDHPKHYNSHPSGIECIDVVRHLNFNVGNAMKYLWRCGIKDGDTEVQDLMKAAWYIQNEIERLRNTA
jgi:hypothetical protein